MLIPKVIQEPFFEQWVVGEAMGQGYADWHEMDREVRKTQGMSMFDVWMIRQFRIHGQPQLEKPYLMLLQSDRDNIQAKVCRITHQIGMRYNRRVRHDSLIRVGPEETEHM